MHMYIGGSPPLRVVLAMLLQAWSACDDAVCNGIPRLLYDRRDVLCNVVATDDGEFVPITEVQRVRDILWNRFVARYS